MESVYMTDYEFEFTVIIPTYNRSAIVLKSLQALSNQTVPPDIFEVIVVDDGSEDDTARAISVFSKETINNIRYLWQPNSGQNAARNLAIKESRGRILLFINSDTIATPTMLEEHRLINNRYSEENVAVLGKITISPLLPPSPIAKLHLDTAFDNLGQNTELDWHGFITCNLSVKKSFLLKYGLFEESLRYNDDLELGERLSHYGLRVVYNPKALGYHYHYLTEEDYLNLAKLSGKTLAVWYKKTPHLKNELTTIGFYLTLPFKHRLKYIISDLIINRKTRPFFIALARFFVDRKESAALMFYRKIYKSIERESIRNELYQK